jgi:hypothetical protein
METLICARDLRAAVTSLGVGGMPRASVMAVADALAPAAEPGLFGAAAVAEDRKRRGQGLKRGEGFAESGKV